jgi:hypothetical protein
MREGHAMDGQLQSWRSGSGQTVWLSTLVEAMERFSSPEWRALPCDQAELSSFRAHLERPAAPYTFASRFSLRN